jgi:hypothetical protein
VSDALYVMTDIIRAIVCLFGRGTLIIAASHGGRFSCRPQSVAHRSVFHTRSHSWQPQLFRLPGPSAHTASLLASRGACLSQGVFMCRRTHPAYAQQDQHTWSPTDRLLRYPDGCERLIRYPSTAQTFPAPAQIVTPSSDSESDDAGGWHICGEHDEGCRLAAEYDTDLPGAAPVGELWGDEQAADGEVLTELEADADSALTAADSHVEVHPDLADAVARRGLLPDSPAALLAYARSPNAVAQRETDTARLQASFAVHWSCPWVQPRQVLVLSRAATGGGTAEVFTMAISRSEVCFAR